MALKFEIPSDYESITIKNFYDWHNAKNDVERIMSISGLSKEEAEKIPLQHYSSILEVFEIGLKKQSSKYQQIITLNGRDYGFIPNLHSMSIGEYIDLTEFSKDIEKNILKISGILYRPITKRINKKYQIEPYSTTENEMRLDEIGELTLEYFNGAMLFFWTLLKELQINSQDYLNKIVEEILVQAKQIGLLTE
jgi:hypothetical protein